ncbi:hypothetical protein RDABS01_032403 [Bienertia sinuspersici]
MENVPREEYNEYFGIEEEFLFLRRLSMPWKNDDGGKVVKLQSKRIVEDFSLLLSEISDDPWKGKVITFSEIPQMHLVKGEHLSFRASMGDDYMVIKRKFEEKGYGDAVPEIVFWNLRDSKSIPVLKDQKGVALASGYSKNMMKLFLDGEHNELNPEAVMKAAIFGDESNKLVVLV